MSNHPEHTAHTEEIDLGYLFRKVNEFFIKLVKIIFQLFSFFVKYKFYVLALIAIGFFIGFYLDANSKKVFKNEVIVIPNFESVDYLYSKVNALNSKIKQNDTIFLRNVFGKENYKNLRDIEIEPIVDLFNFASKSRENIDVLRILIENQEIESFAEHIVTSKYYKYHLINFNVVGKNSEKIINDVVNYWNTNEHYKAYASIFKENAKFQVEQNKIMINQIDSILTSISRSENTLSQGLVIKENANIHFLMERKRDLLDESLASEIRLSDYESPIKIVSINNNIETKGVPNKIFYPILLVFLFSSIFLVRYSYKRLKEIAHQ